MRQSIGRSIALGSGAMLLGLAFAFGPAAAVEEIPYSDVDRYGQSKSGKAKTGKANSCPKGTRYSEQRRACVRIKSSCASGQVWSGEADACLDGKSAALSDDELYAAAYDLSQSGQYTGALTILFRIKNREQPRVLNSIGYSTRKLGDVEKGIEYYHQALELDPNYTKARQYLGEAYLLKDDVAKAKEQMVEIGERCGGPCEDYRLLVNAIAAHVTGEKNPGW